MSILRYLGSAALLIILAAIVLTGHRSENRGRLLYQEYFSATPVAGYGQLRAFGATTDTDLSIFQQAVRYHQAGDYDLALVGLRAYLEGNGAGADAYLLAVTAAMAAGEHEEAKEYLAAFSPEEEVRQWYGALLLLRAEEMRVAVWGLRSAEANLVAAGYPVRELLDDL